VCSTGHSLIEEEEGQVMPRSLGRMLGFKGQLRRKMNLWSNYTLLPSQPLSEIFFHDCRM